VTTTAYDSARYAAANRWDPRHLATLQRLLAPSPGMRLLEVGCGRGHLLRRVQDQGIDAIGIDVNPEAAAAAVTRNVLSMSATDLEFPDGSFDQVYSMHAIEHIPDAGAALGEMSRVVRPGGSVMLVYPAEPMRGLYAVPSAVILYGNPFRAGEVHCHRFTPRRLARLAQNAGLTEVISEFHLLSSPEFATLLVRPGRR
jgi:ubiquinone/menaquinone biosynthesis C-methylase UbiE